MRRSLTIPSPNVSLSSMALPYPPGYSNADSLFRLGSQCGVVNRVAEQIAEDLTSKPFLAMEIQLWVAMIKATT